MLADLQIQQHRSRSQTGFLAVCGLMGSGKTTLARGLARSFNWSYAPESLPATLFIPDQFLDTKRWAFEAQIAFLIHKALTIQDAIRRGISIVFDRSLFEDVHVFARYFYEHGDIDDRSYTTYRALASHLLSSVPLPQIAILCSCPLETIRKRIHLRARDFQRLYPPDHLERLHRLYEEWRETYDYSDLYILDTELYDTRNPQVLSAVAKELVSIMESKATYGPQLGLFYDSLVERFEPTILKAQYKDNPISAEYAIKERFRLSGVRKPVMAYPSAYIGGPFTAQLTPLESTADTLFDIESPHGLLRPGPFRSFLTDIERCLRGMGITPFLPHREINRWGRRKVPSEEVAALCSDYVRECDVFVGIPGLSNGTHFELGLAIGLGKPTIVLHCEEIPRSYLSNGIVTSDRLLVLRCGEMRQVTRLLESSEVKAFLSRHIPLDFAPYGQQFDRLEEERFYENDS